MLALLASYLNLPGPDMRLLYGFGVAFVAIAIAMVVFRGISKWKEKRQIRRSSWRTFAKIAKVKGLSKLEEQTLSRVIREARVDRPTQVLGAMTLFDRCVDRAVDKGAISDDEQAILDNVRDRLVKTTTKWDGRTNRRQFERAAFAFEVQTSLVTKEALDEELKSSYDEDDAKFKTSLEELSTQVPPIGARMLDVSAGGFSLLAQDKEPIRPGDFLRLTANDDTISFQIEGMVGRVLAFEKMDDQKQLVIHASFLPYDQEIRKQIINLVYTVPEKPPAKAKKGAKAKQKAHAAKSASKSSRPRPKLNEDPTTPEAQISGAEGEAPESIEANGAE